jgi:GH24 family phage-related lysozyme (muramidase)
MTEKKRKKKSRAMVPYRRPVNHAPPARPIRYSIIQPNRYGGILLALSAIAVVAAAGVVAWTLVAMNQKSRDAVPVIAIQTQAELMAEQAANTTYAAPTTNYIMQTVIVVVTATPLPPAKKVSDEGRKFIAFFEGNSQIAFFDVGRHCTIGIGHLVDPIWCIGELKAKDDDIKDWFDDDIKNTEKYLATRLGMVRLNQCQFDALASFHFNLGNYYFDYSGMVEILQKGEFDSVPDVFAKFVYSEGIGPIEGMQVRRAAEAKLFEECVYPGS